MSDPFTEQRALAECLRRLGTRLEQQHEADPVLVMETALAALAVTRTWLESDTVLAALAVVPRAQLTWWEHEVVENEAYVAWLHEGVHTELDSPSEHGTGIGPILSMVREGQASMHLPFPLPPRR